MDKVYEDKYLIINKEELPNRKTPIYHIMSWDDIELGIIKWYQSWRKYCFFPNGNTIWDNKCLASLYTYLVALNDSNMKGK